MEASPIFFYLFAVLGIACSLLVILQKNPVSSAFALILAFFSFAGVYATLGAHLVAALQIVVYTGAVLVLFVFVIMLLNADTPSFDLNRVGMPGRIGALVVGTVLLGFLVFAFRTDEILRIPVTAKGNYTQQNIEAAGGNTQVLSELLFSDYILPFELTSFLLLACIVGTVVIAMRRKKLDENPDSPLSTGSSSTGAN